MQNVDKSPQISSHADLYCVTLETASVGGYGENVLE